MRSHRDDRYAFRKYLHDDATVLACYRLGGLTDREDARHYYPVGLPNHCMASDIESALIDFIALMRAHAMSRQSNAGFQVRVGLVGNPSEPSYIRTTESNTNYLLSAEYAEPIHSFQLVSAKLDPLAPIETVMPVANDLARDVINQGGVEFLKVMAEPGDD